MELHKNNKSKTVFDPPFSGLIKKKSQQSENPSRVEKC